MQIWKYTHQYVKKVCRGELPLSFTFKCHVVCETLCNYFTFSISKQANAIFWLSEILECMYMIPKSVNWHPVHCIAQQNNPIYYRVINDVALGFNLEMLVKKMIWNKEVERAFGREVYFLYLEHLKWTCEQDGVIISNFPSYKNALLGSRRVTGEQIYAIINEVFTYKLKHNG